MRNKIINTKTLSGGVRLLLISVFCVIVPVAAAQESTPSATVQNKQDELIISTQSGSFEYGFFLFALAFRFLHCLSLKRLYYRDGSDI